MSISKADLLLERTNMPKGIPKTEGEKIGDRFDVEYRKMKRKTKAERAAKKSDAPKKGGCDCCGK